jgi:branched-subunit amino acid aminotransferase/4-amino-4-deoxychorismate lyase
MRARMLAAMPADLEAREEPISLERLRAADEILLSSSIRGVHPATMRGRDPGFGTGARVRAALAEEPVGVGAP